MFEASLLRLVTAQGWLANSVIDVVCLAVLQHCHAKLQPEAVTWTYLNILSNTMLVQHHSVPA
jgi:hypothetical protein